MNRKDFVKLLGTMIVAPSVLVDNLQPSPPLPSWISGEAGLGLYETSTVTAGSSQAVGYYKLTSQMLEDPGYMKHMVEGPDSQLWRRMKQYGVDMARPYTMEIGWDGDDFVQNAATMVVRQKLPEA